MNDETPLDHAWTAAADEAAGEGGMARYYDVFAATELFLLIDPATLEGGGAPQPTLFPVDGADTALVFDTEARLADFVEDGAAHLTLSGRAVIGMFAGSGVQLGVNLGDAPSATILPAPAIDWAAEALRQPIEAALDQSVTLTLPRGVLPTLLTALDAKLAGMGAVVAEAWLCGTGGGRRSEGLILCLVMRTPGAEQAAVAALRKPRALRAVTRRRSISLCWRKMIRASTRRARSGSALSPQPPPRRSRWSAQPPAWIRPNRPA